jgi:UDP-sulfoquinovose synthase
MDFLTRIDVRRRFHVIKKGGEMDVRANRVASDSASKGTILVLGGDGFCGWPTSLHLSAVGYDVAIVDNLSRRKIDIELGTESLTPIQTPQVRLAKWANISGKTIRFHNLTLGSDYTELVELLKNERPTAIVHFAEQRAAPYSMKSPQEMRYTVRNNLNGTHDLLCAVVDAGCHHTHIVHLGTMGVYGYGTAGVRVPEGYLPVVVQTDNGPQEIEILYPADPGSIYHMTKTQDALFFHYYNKNYGIRITDLHQGIVWGTQTKETRLAPELVNRFDYCGDYGTVLNRFLVEAAIGYPLTVDGSGGQTRAFINIRDTVRCIELACTAPGSLDKRLAYAARLKGWSCQAARASSGLRWRFFSISHLAL